MPTYYRRLFLLGSTIREILEPAEGCSISSWTTLRKKKLEKKIPYVLTAETAMTVVQEPKFASKKLFFLNYLFFNLKKIIKINK